MNIENIYYVAVVAGVSLSIETKSNEKNDVSVSSRSWFKMHSTLFIAI